MKEKQKTELENLVIGEGKMTPFISCDIGGTIKINGRSHMENALEFYEKLNKWLDEYLANPAEKTRLVFSIMYYNSVTSKMFVRIIRKILKVKKTKIEILWLYAKDDELIQDQGKALESVTVEENSNVFQFIEIDEEDHDYKSILSDDLLASVINEATKDEGIIDEDKEQDFSVSIRLGHLRLNNLICKQLIPNTSVVIKKALPKGKAYEAMMLWIDYYISFHEKSRKTQVVFYLTEFENKAERSIKTIVQKFAKVENFSVAWLYEEGNTKSKEIYSSLSKKLDKIDWNISVVQVQRTIIDGNKSLDKILE